MTEIIASDQNLLQPGFYFHTGLSGEQKYKSKYIYLSNGKLDVSSKSFSFGYRGSYPEQRFEWLNAQFDRSLGQVMYYRRYELGEVFVCDDWYNNSQQWTIIVIDSNDQISKYIAQKTSIFDSLHAFSTDGENFYLHCRTENDELIISRILVSDGSQYDYHLPMADHPIELLGQVNLLSYFDPKTESYAFLYRDGSDTHLAVYNFKTCVYQSHPLEYRYNRLVSDGVHYYLIGHNISGKLLIGVYDHEWKFVRELETLPYTSADQIKALGGITDFGTGTQIYLYEGILYGYLSGVDGTLFWAVDITTGDPVASYLIDQPENYFLDELAVYDNNGISPYPFLHIRHSYFSLLPPHSTTVKPSRVRTGSSCGSMSTGSFSGS